MSQKIQVRRGTDASRKTVVFDVGEPVFTTDTKKFFVGDGVTSGGLAVATIGNSENYLLVDTTSDPMRNGLNLTTAVALANTMTPYGKGISRSNRLDILLPEGIYELGTTKNIYLLNEGMGLCGIGNRENIIINGSLPGIANVSSGVITHTGDYTILKNFTISANKTGNNTFVAAPSCISSVSFSAQKFTNSYFSNLILTYLGTGSIPGGVYPSDIWDFGGNIFSPNIENVIMSGTFNSYRLNSFGGILKNVTALADYGLAFKGGGYDSSARVIDCTVIGKSGLGGVCSPENVKPPLFLNCYTSGRGNPFWADPDNFLSNTLFYKNCVFINTDVTNFEGTMDNCYLTSYDEFKPVIDMTNNINNYAARFYNCTIIGGSGCPVSITGTSSSRVFITHSRLNKPITGVNMVIAFNSGFNILNSSGIRSTTLPEFR